MATLTIEDLDIESIVQDWIDNNDILADVDVGDIVREEIERVELLEDIDIDKIVTARVEELVDDVEFHSYKSLREEFLGNQEWQERVGIDINTLKDIVKSQAVEITSLRNSRFVIDEDIRLTRTAFLMLKAKVERPWYKIW